MSVSSADRSRTGRALAASAESLLMPVLDELKVIASVVSTHFAAPPVPSSRLEELRDRFETLLERPGALASGAGYLAAPGTLADVNLFEAWWERDGDAIVPHSLDFDRLSEEFYDYSTKDFYLLPASTSLPALIGPYLDYLGTNHYIFTLAVPVLVGSEFAGTVGVDIPSERLQDRILESMPIDTPGLALVTKLGRVILSTDASVEPGSLIKDKSLVDWFAADAHVPSSLGTRQVWPVGSFPWAVVTVGNE